MGIISFRTKNKQHRWLFVFIGICDEWKEKKNKFLCIYISVYLQEDLSVVRSTMKRKKGKKKNNDLLSIINSLAHINLRYARETSKYSFEIAENAQVFKKSLDLFKKNFVRLVKQSRFQVS